jgi:hypothetical protein
MTAPTVTSAYVCIKYLWAQRQTSATLVLEIVQLLCDFFTSFAYVKVFAFQHRCVIFLEAIAMSDILPFSEQPVTKTLVLGEEVSSALKCHIRNSE